MTCQLTTVPLTDEQKGQICGILSVGCDRETAANFVGCSVATVGRAMQQDAAFAGNVLRTEAGTELGHMRNVQQAAKESKNWRASVWWLERHSPERFGPRGAGAVTARQLKEFIESLAGIFYDEVHDLDDQQRVIARFDQAISTLRESIRSTVAVATASSSEPEPDNTETDSEDEPTNLLTSREDI